MRSAAATTTTALALAALVAAAHAYLDDPASDWARRLQFAGYQNIFALSDANHATFDVGGPGEEAAKKCAGLCGMHSWCGACYLAYTVSRTRPIVIRTLPCDLQS